MSLTLATIAGIVFAAGKKKERGVSHYVHGIDCIGGDAGDVWVGADKMLRVKSKNTAVYAVNFMQGDRPGADLGDPVMTLQPGEEVLTLGVPAANPKGVLYTPVAVKGREGPHWIRSSSLEEGTKVSSAKVVPWLTQPAWKNAPVNRWQAGLGGVAALAIVGGLAGKLRW